MKKILTLVIAFSLLMGCVCAFADGIGLDALRIQFVPTNTETADAATADFSAYMSNLLGIPVNVTVATSYNGIVEAMESGTVDVGIMPPATYAQAREMGVAEAILSSTLVDYDQETETVIEGSVTGNFKAEVLVRKDSGIEGYEGLAGKTIAYLGASSASGYIYPVAEMKKLGIDVDSCNWVNITSIPSAILAVINGQVDACFTFEGSRAVFAKAVLDDNGNPYDLYEVLSVAKLSDGDIPNDAVAVNPKLSDDAKAAVRDAFLKMASDEAGLAIMSTWGHTGYVPSNESDYDTIAEYIALAAD
ncbi:MAG: phosphate/phosphite/phosphonate ABC transporter substrate-binding protein [Clostridia bacterium]|nr:phosphate/phosphite/phosphonate ABC transporter substrate-binding protein [Clostridia bacterium]